MKKLLIMSLFLAGCATSSQKATNYCDVNWQGRYNTWQDCYDRMLSEQNKGLRAAGTMLSGMGQGLQNSQRNTVNCTTWGNQTTCR